MRTLDSTQSIIREILEGESRSAKQGKHEEGESVFPGRYCDVDTASRIFLK